MLTESKSYKKIFANFLIRIKLQYKTTKWKVQKCTFGFNKGSYRQSTAGGTKKSPLCGFDISFIYPTR